MVSTVIDNIFNFTIFLLDIIDTYPILFLLIILLIFLAIILLWFKDDGGDDDGSGLSPLCGSY